jgi:hypothetical protein
VGLRLDAGRPVVVVRERIVIADPADPAARFPYHAVEELPLSQAEKRVAAYEAGVQRLAKAAVQNVVAKAGDVSLLGLGLLDSIGQKPKTVADALAAHAMMHTAEGELFRTAIVKAADACRLPLVRIPAKELAVQASRKIGRPAAALEKTLGELKREVGAPWGKDQRSAALAAWLLLASEI